MPAHPELDFLDAEHRIYTLWKPVWLRQERRAFGTAALDLMRFKGESDERFAVRQDRATYVNFMRAHARAVTGQLRQMGAPPAGDPRFSMGSLGPVRPVDQVRPDDQSFGEIVYYDVDSVGGDGSEWPVWFDEVDVRAQHTGHRLCMIETPPKRPVRTGSAPVLEPVVTLSDVRAGQRPYALQFSPLQERMWATVAGRKEFSILRVAQDTGHVEDGKWVEPAQIDAAGNGLGYYLLVRRGCALLGAQYARGGYWLFDADKRLLRTGLWGNTGGEIPLWYHYGEKDDGTTEEPAVSHCATDGLGRVGVSLMDMLSARDWDAFDAAASRKWFLGANRQVMQDVLEQWDAKSENIAVPPAFDENSGSSQPVTLYDDSAGAVAPAVFQAIISAKFEEAKEQSFQTLTSTPDASGVSKDASFQENKAPYLSMRASYRQQSEQTGIRFFEMRFGKAPSGFCHYARDFTLAPVQEDIEAAFDMLRAAGIRSPTMEPEMAIRAVKERLGTLPQPAPVQGETPQTPEEYEQAVRVEMQESIQSAQRSADQAAALTASFGA